MLFAKASIGRKLFLAFIAMALLVLMSALIGVLGFRSVAKTERDVVNTAIPSMIEARQVSELSARIISSVQSLANANTEQQRQASGKELFSQLESLLNHIKQLGSDSFDSQLLSKLEGDVQDVIDGLAQLGIVVEKRLFLTDDLSVRTTDLRQLASQLEELTRTQVSNTSTIAVANVAHIYDLLEKGKINSVYQALDTLVEVDLDLAERLHELHLLAFKTLNNIEEIQTLSDLDRMNIIREEYSNNIEIMQRRVQAVEDPTRSIQMADLLIELERRDAVFDVLQERYKNELAAQQLMKDILDQFSQLNATVSRLVDYSNNATTHAVKALKTTMNYAQLSLILITVLGLISAVLIVWKIVYAQVLSSLSAYSSALSAIAKGDLNVELSVKGDDELAQMGHAIITARDTAQELEEHQLHLEVLVTERTHQLQLANERLNEEVVNHAEARLEAEQASKAKSAFLATMSHEIRTPMNGVLGTARLLQDEGLNSQQSYYVDIINRSGTTLLAILNDILDYSKIEAGHLEIRSRDFNLKLMVEDVARLLKGKAQEKQLELSCLIESDLEGCWIGDVTRISQVLNNLVSNAIKFTDQGYVDIYVAKDPDNEDNVLFEVSDSGIGISLVDQGSLFDAFTQVTAGLSSNGGTGLGLAISKKLVEAMQGDLLLESSLGEGSRFSFSIPLQQCENPSFSDVATGELLRGKILLIEDNPVNCLVAEGFLSSLGHQVDTATDGRLGHQLFGRNKYDIALIDINLPDYDGIQLINEFRAFEVEKQVEHTPMIAVSAHVFNEEVESYLAAGFDSYLPKPLNKDDLSQVIQSCLEGKLLMLPQEIGKPADKNMDIELVDFHMIESDLAVLGKDKMIDIVRLFEVGSKEILTQMQVAANLKDNEQTKQLAHKLKGSASSLGLLKLFELCKAIEMDREPLSCYAANQTYLLKLVEQSQYELRQIIGLEF